MEKNKKHLKLTRAFYDTIAIVIIGLISYTAACIFSLHSIFDKALKKIKFGRLPGEELPILFAILVFCLVVFSVRRWFETRDEIQRRMVAEESLKKHQNQLEDLVIERTGEIIELQKQVEFILSATKTGLDIIDSDYNIVYIDNGWKKVYGDPKGKKCYEYFMGRSRVCPACGVKKALDTKKMVVTEETLAKEGNRPVQVTTIPYQDESGEWFVAEVNVDISERKRMEDELKKHRDHLEELVNERTKELVNSEERFRTIFNKSLDGLLLVDMETGRFLMANGSICAMLGYSEEEILRLSIVDIHPKSERDYILKQFQRLKNRDIEGLEALPVMRKDGSTFYADLTSFLVTLSGKEYIMGSFRDVTERELLQKKIKMASEDWQATFDAATDMIMQLDTDMRIVRANRSALKILGMTADEIIGKKCHKIVHRTDTPFPGCPVSKSLATKKHEWSEFFLPNLGIWASISADPILGEDGEVAGVVHTVRDVTERKKIQEELRQERDRATSYLNTVETIIVAFDRDGKITTVNRKGCDVLGYSEGELIGKFWFTTCLPQPYGMEEVYTVFLELMKGNTKGVEYFENAILTKRGELRQVAWHNVVIRDQEGNIAGTLSSGEDITERKKAEEALKASEENYRTIFESVNDAVMIREIDTFRISDVNRKTCEMFCYSREEMLGLEPAGLSADYPEHSNKKYKELLERVSAGEPQLFEWPVKDKFGREFWVEVNMRRAVVGGRYMILSVARDITERKALSEQKDHFVNTVSHELRTPLGAIKESIALISEGKVGPVSEKQKEIIGLAGRNVERLKRLIDQTLDLQKIDAGRMDLSLDEYDINEILKEAQRTMISLTSKKGIKFTLELAEKLPPVKCDKDRIVEVLINVIGNAIKFTDKGSIVMSSSRGNNFIRISVSDTGCGIRAEELPKIFDRFVQFDKKMGGTGLGLSICKEIVELHKGKIWGESEFGKGTTVHIVLPIKERRV